MATPLLNVKNHVLKQAQHYMDKGKDENCKEYQELMEYETSELPVLPKDKIDKLDEYPFLPIQYGLMLELIEEEEVKNNADV